MHSKSLKALLLVGAAALLTGCGLTSPCGPSMCSGCCDNNGVCQGGQTQTLCGARGGMCMSCPSGMVCSEQGVCAAPPVCVPKTCSELGANCGEVDDGCGGTLRCGTCGTGQNCGGGGKANVCGPGTCTPKDCTAQLFECGRASDGCAAVLECGTCASPKKCGGGGEANRCGGCAVTATCASQGKNCGAIPDGCGGTLQCGSCGMGQSCGAGGVANVCGAGTCTPTTCAAQGKNCGTISDGCSQVLTCGSCPTGINCGGGGVANVCGATCTIACPQGFTCNTYGQCKGNLSNLILNEVGHAVSGVVRVNGALPTYDSAYCASRPGYEIGRVRFTEKTRGYSASVGIDCGTSNWAWQTVLPPGTYEVRVEVGSYGDSANVNLLPVSYLAEAALAVTAPVANLTLNEVGHAVSGVVRVNGATPTYDPAYCSSRVGYEIGRVRFSEKTKGYYASVSIDCGTSNFNWQTLLPPGTWEVRVEQGSYGDSANVNLLPVSYLVQSALAVSAPVSNLVLNEVGYTVSGVVRVNGATPTYDATYCQSRIGYEIGRVRFTEKTLGYSASTSIDCGTSNWDWQVLLPPGTYEVRVEQGSYGDSANVNLLPVSYEAQGALTVSAPVSNLVLNEVGHAVSGTVRVNGAVPTYDTAYCQSRIGYEIGRVRFTEKTKGYSASVGIDCGTTNFAWQVLLPPGTYEVRVEQGSYGGSANVNLLPVSYQAQAALQVNGPVSNLVLNEQGFAVSGVVQVNGQVPTYDAAYCQSRPGYEIGRVRLVEKTLGYSAAASIACGTTNFAWQVLLPLGTYEVRVEQGSYGDSANVSLLPVSYLAQPALQVSAAVANVVLNEVARSVSGVVRVNGQVPTYDITYCSSRPGYEIGRVRFTERAKGYSASTSIDCGTTDFAFLAKLPPGVWDVRVEQGSYGDSAQVSLLPVSYFAVERLLVE